MSDESLQDKIKEVTRPRCGSCMWLHHNPPHMGACATLDLADKDGNKVAITETSEICERYTPKNEQLEGVYEALRACEKENLHTLKNLVINLVKYRKDEDLIPLEPGDIVSFKLYENGQEFFIPKAKVQSVGKATFQAAYPDPKNSSEIEVSKLPRDINTLVVVRRRNLMDGDGVKKLRKDNANEESILKAKLNHAKHAMTVLKMCRRASGDDGKAILDDVKERIKYDEDELNKCIDTLREYKMLARQSGKYKITTFGKHSLRRLEKSTNVFRTWEKLVQVKKPEFKLIAV